MMNYFDVFLVVLLLACALIGFLGPIVRKAPAPVATPTQKNGKTTKPFSGYREFFWMLLVVVCLRSFVMEPFKVPSGSMIPTLLINDYLSVNKHAYALKIPATDIVFYKIASPQRGDVVVFTPPHTGREFWVKRIIGVPGDTIRFEQNTLTVNGKQVPSTDLGAYNEQSNQPWAQDDQRKEQLNGIEHRILQDPNGGNPQSFGEWIVPKDKYFVMGDNRNNSLDSRFWGFVDENAIKGRVGHILFNTSTPDKRVWKPTNTY